MSELLKRLLKLKTGKKEKLCLLAKLSLQKDGEEERKQEVDELLTSKVLELGVSSVASLMTIEALKRVVKPKEDDKKDKKKMNKNALTREFERLLTEPEKFLAKADDDTLDVFIQVLDLELDNKSAKKEQREKIYEGIVEDGVRTLFANIQIDKETALALCKSVNLKVTKHHAKQQLVEAFVTGDVPEVEKKAKKPEDEEPCEKKPNEIKKGLKFADLYHHYQSEELKQWLKDHNVRNSGTKKEMVKRIVAFLDGDKSELIDPDAPKKGRGKRKAKEGEKPSPKKQKVGKGKTKAVDEASEEEKEEKEEKKDDKKKDKEDKKEEVEKKPAKKGRPKKSVK